MENFLIRNTATVYDALSKLDLFSSDTLTLFVIDKKDKMIGTLTDGDIRRGLLKNVSLSDSVENVMHTNFAFLNAERIDLNQLRQFKNNNIQLIPVLDAERRISKIINLKRKKSLLQIDAVLMAGGRGERLRPLTDTIPKPLLKLGNKSIIDYNIESFISYGIENINVTVHYLADQIINHVMNYTNDINIACFKEDTPLGTFGSIKRITPVYNDFMLIMNADLFTNIDYEDFFLTFLESEAEMAIATIPYTINIPYAILDIEYDKVTGFIEKPVVTHYANAGIYLIKKGLIELIPESYFNATDFIQLLIDSGKKIIKYPIAGYWVDIGRPEDFKMVQELVKHINTK
jgi:dTDP-glucose pyrophosphorylase